MTLPAAVARNRYNWFGVKPRCTLPGRVQVASAELLQGIIDAGARAGAQEAEAAARCRAATGAGRSRAGAG
jgi:hypothetical protein